MRARAGRGWGGGPASAEERFWASEHHVRESGAGDGGGRGRGRAGGSAVPALGRARRGSRGLEPDGARGAVRHPQGHRAGVPRRAGPVLTRDPPRGARCAPAPRRAARRPVVARGNGPGLRGALCKPRLRGERGAGPGGGGAAAGAGRGAARARGRRGASGAAAAGPAGPAARVGRGSLGAAVSGVSAGPGAGAAVRGVGVGAGAQGHGILGERRGAPPGLGVTKPHQAQGCWSQRPSLAVRGPQVTKSESHNRPLTPPHAPLRPSLPVPHNSRGSRDRDTVPGVAMPGRGLHTGCPHVGCGQSLPAGQLSRPGEEPEGDFVSPGSFMGASPTPPPVPAAPSVPHQPKSLSPSPPPSSLPLCGGRSKKDPPTLLLRVNF